jgi:hypothetical protein
MATLATVFNRFWEKTVEGSASPAGTARVPCRVRNFANEDIYFYVKRIDNTGVVRRADPEESGVCWRMIGTAGAAVVLLIAVLLPGAYGLLASYQIQALQREAQKLTTEQTSLAVEEARMISPARMEELARIQQFIDPLPQTTVH